MDIRFSRARHVPLSWRRFDGSRGCVSIPSKFELLVSATHVTYLRTIRRIRAISSRRSCGSCCQLGAHPEILQTPSLKNPDKSGKGRCLRCVSVATACISGVYFIAVADRPSCVLAFLALILCYDASSAFRLTIHSLYHTSLVSTRLRPLVRRCLKKDVGRKTTPPHPSSPHPPPRDLSFSPEGQRR